MVHQVQSECDFKDQLKAAGGKLVVVDFFATWCGPCKMIAPKIVEMSSSMPDVVFLKVDVDECEEVAIENKISAMPTFVFFKNGEKVDSFSGASEDLLRKTIAKHS